MTGDRIEFIGEYCDRWCERCEYTSRCSVFACHDAVVVTTVAEAGHEREAEARRERIERLPLRTMSFDYTGLSYRWLTAHEAFREAPDPAVREALAIVAHDSVFIGAKLGRALTGRDRYYHGDDREDDPVQSDWNGSAKAAIISIERSEAAWRVIADATGDSGAASLADLARVIRHVVYQEFPRVMAFVRPGFDQPGR